MAEYMFDYRCNIQYIVDLVFWYTGTRSYTSYTYLQPSDARLPDCGIFEWDFASPNPSWVKYGHVTVGIFPKKYVLGREIWQIDLTCLGESFKKDDPIGDNKF